MPADEKQTPAGRKQALKDTPKPGDIHAELVRIRETQERFVIVGERVITMLTVINDKADLLIEAATKEPGPSPVAKMLEAVLAALTEQSATLARLPAELAAAITEDEEATSEPADHIAWNDPDTEE